MEIYMIYTEDREFCASSPEAVYDWVKSQCGEYEAQVAMMVCSNAMPGEEYESESGEIRIEIRSIEDEQE